MFWVNAEEYLIERAWLDGSARRTVFAETRRGQSSPHFLAVDVRGAKLFWFEVDPQQIVSTDLDGHNHKLIRQSPFGLYLTVFQVLTVTVRLDTLGSK